VRRTGSVPSPSLIPWVWALETAPVKLKLKLIVSPAPEKFITFIKFIKFIKFNNPRIWSSGHI